MKKFIVTCSSRTGATLLVDSLGQHASVLALGEIFMPDAVERRRANTVAGRAWDEGEDAAAFVRDWVFAERGHAAVGFKFMYYDGMPGTPLEAARRFLVEARDVAVIHLWRDNLLARHLSDLVAQQTQRWALTVGEARPPELAPLVLDPRKLRGAFKWIEERKDDTAAAFAGHPLLELEYQRDLALAFPATMERLFSFLGVSPISVEKRFIKQATRPLREQIANWDDLRDFFAPTRFSRFFADDSTG